MFDKFVVHVNEEELLNDHFIQSIFDIITI